MKKSMWMVGCLLFGVYAMGCTPSPEKVCKKMMELAKKEADDDDKKKKKKSDDDDEKDFLKECVKDVEKKKEKEPEMYTCMAKCINGADTMKAAMSGCKKECKSKEKKKDDDDDDGDKKKKKSKDDDDK